MLSEEEFTCEYPAPDASYAVLGVVLALVGVVALVVLYLNRSVFISKYQKCKDTMTSKPGATIYSSLSYQV